jgi:hypothetical protein
VFELPDLTLAPVIGPLAARVRRCGAEVQLSPGLARRSACPRARLERSTDTKPTASTDLYVPAMAASEAASPLVLTLVAGGFTTFGVLLKIGYDTIAARRATRSARLDRFAQERREAYERFYTQVQQQRKRTDALRTLIVASHEGKTDISEKEQAAFPPSVLDELITSLDQVRRLARLYSVITAAEAIVQLFLDMTAASRPALETPANDDEITWFVLQRFMDDRISEFVHGYRLDLGLGRPVGAPKTWPVVQRKRPWTIEQSETIIRTHIWQKRKEMPGPKPPDS